MTHLVLYDGACGLCDHFVRFLVRIDRRDQLRFASLQGPTGSAIPGQARRIADTLSTVIVVVNHGTSSARVLDRSDAAIFAIASAGGFWKSAEVLSAVPRFVRDPAYDLVARWRYRVFGRFDACPLPAPAARGKFLDLTPP